MNKIATACVVVVIASNATYVVAQNQLKTTLDLAVHGMMYNGAEISYGKRIIGADGSVEYIDLVISDPDGEITLSTDWIKGVPVGADVTFTVADIVNVSGIAEDAEFQFQIQSSGLGLTTNGLLREAMSTEDITVTFLADEFVIDGANPDSSVLRRIFLDTGAIGFDLLISAQEMFAKGALQLAKMDLVYDYTMEGKTQMVKQTAEATSVSFEFDIPADEDDALGYLDGSKLAVFSAVSGAAEFVSTIITDDIEMQMSGSTGAGSVLFEIVNGIVTYDVNADGFDMAVTPEPGMPFPQVEIGMGKLGIKIVVPAGAVDTPEEMSIDILFADMVVGEGLWSMFDPDKTISRDPAQMDIDIEAMVQIDPMAAVTSNDPLSFATIYNLDINQILLAIAGASIQVDGAATFDNSGPIPSPLGIVNIQMDGISTLADQLVALGLLDQMQAAIALGMIMAFGAPGPEVDQFISEISFSESGISANGKSLW